MKHLFIHLPLVALCVAAYPAQATAQDDDSSVSEAPALAPDTEKAAPHKQDNKNEKADTQEDASTADDKNTPPQASLKPPQMLGKLSLEKPVWRMLPNEESVTLRIEVSETGQAKVIECPAPEEWCFKVLEALRDIPFQAATRDGKAISSIISLKLTPPPDEGEKSSSSSSPPLRPGESKEGQAKNRSSGGDFSAVAVVDKEEPAAIELSMEELREIPGAFGDPFRALEALPGVVPVLSGLPFYYVRGAPPSGSRTFYDGIPVPMLFHFAAGPAVVHPRTLGDIKLYPGVPPARYGGLVGGAFVGLGPKELFPEETNGEVQLRLSDANAHIEVPTKKGAVFVSGRWGYPTTMIQLFAPELSIHFGDYQLRWVHKLGSKHRRFELVWFGSIDAMRIKGDDEFEDEGDFVMRLHFHRAEARFVLEKTKWDFGVAGRFSAERTLIGEETEEISVSNISVGPRAWATRRFEKATVRMFAEAYGTISPTSSSRLTQDLLEGIIFANPEIIEQRYRSSASVASEVNWQPFKLLELDLGARSDLWTVGDLAQGSVDGRSRVTLHWTDRFATYAAIGTAHQPVVSSLPFPGLSELPVDRGLMSSIQNEVGTKVEIPWNLTLDVKGFLNRYRGLAPPLLIEEEDLPPSNDDVPRFNGWGYGGELLLRRPLVPKQTFSGWFAYTLSWADYDELEYTPPFDVRHVMNTVAMWRFKKGWRLGTRFFLRSGSPALLNDADDGRVERLPWFPRLDLQVSYSWTSRRARWEFKLEWMNVTISKEPIGFDCPSDADSANDCSIERIPIVIPNLGIKATF